MPAPPADPVRPAPAARPSRARRLLFAGVASAALLVLLEGAASLVLFVLAAPRELTAPLAERRHTRHDPDLGWANRPGAAVRDVYAPGRGVTINAQGFRGRRDVKPEPAPGRVRVVVSGDSFSFGYGVGDDESLPAALEALDPRLECVNMGLGGYGVDQAYLWFRRDGLRFRHHLHLFALTSPSFERSGLRRFLGYPKPHLEIAQGALETRGLPVPRRAYATPWLTQNLPLLRRLRLYELGARVAGSPGAAAPGIAGDIVLAPREAFQVTLALLADVARRDAEHGSALAVVWLPQTWEFGPSHVDPLRQALARALAERGIPWVDLTEELRAVPPDRLAALFLAADEVKLPGAGGHYSASGNRHFAERLLARLRALPATAARLAPEAGAPASLPPGG